jgi:hypothetical protein
VAIWPIVVAAELETSSRKTLIAHRRPPRPSDCLGGHGRPARQVVRCRRDRWRPDGRSAMRVSGRVAFVVVLLPATVIARSSALQFGWHVSLDHAGGRNIPAQAFAGRGFVPPQLGPIRRSSEPKLQASTLWRSNRQGRRPYARRCDDDVKMSVSRAICASSASTPGVPKAS